MTTMLLGVVEEGTGKGAKIPGRELAGKTGSTQVPIEGINGTKDQWFVGYTPQLVGAVWVGYDKTDKDHFLTTTSSEGAALVFKDFMSEALKDSEAVSFNVPDISKYVEEQKKAKRAKTVKELEERMKKESQKLKKQWEQAKEKVKGKKEDKSETEDKKKETTGPKVQKTEALIEEAKSKGNEVIKSLKEKEEPTGPKEPNPPTKKEENPE